MPPKCPRGVCLPGRRQPLCVVTPATRTTRRCRRRRRRFWRRPLTCFPLLTTSRGRSSGCPNSVRPMSRSSRNRLRIPTPPMHVDVKISEPELEVDVEVEKGVGGAGSTGAQPLLTTTPPEAASAGSAGAQLYPEGPSGSEAMPSAEEDTSPPCLWRCRAARPSPRW